MILGNYNITEFQRFDYGPDNRKETKRLNTPGKLFYLLSDVRQHVRDTPRHTPRHVRDPARHCHDVRTTISFALVHHVSNKLL